MTTSARPLLARIARTTRFSTIASDGGVPKGDVFEPLHHSLASSGADAAIATYRDLREHEVDRYELRDLDLLVVGLKPLRMGRTEEAAAFLSADLDLYPTSTHTASTCARLAQADERLRRTSSAIEHARRALAARARQRGRDRRPGAARACHTVTVPAGA